VTHDAKTLTAVAGDHIQRLRLQRGWTGNDLAERCAELGKPGLNRSVIANIESGRRRYVTVHELFVLAVLLDVAPAYLLFPWEPDAQVQVTPTMVATADRVRAWIRGDRPLDDTDGRKFASQTPWREYDDYYRYGEQLLELVTREQEIRGKLAELGLTDQLDEPTRAALEDLLTCVAEQTRLHQRRVQTVVGGV